MDLKHVPNLHIFAIHAIIQSYAEDPVVSRDINSILGTIPKANQVTQLSIRFDFFGTHPFGGCIDQDWVGMCDEIVRVTAGKPLELCLKMSIVLSQDRPFGDRLYKRIKEKIASLSDYPNIRTDIWHP